MPVHEPEFDDAKDKEWNAPDLEDFDTDDLSEVDDHFVGSRTEFPPDAFGELAWPVVEPDGTLNLNALQNAAARIEQTEGFSDEEKEEARNIVGSLAEDNFPDADFKSAVKKKQIRIAIEEYTPEDCIGIEEIFKEDEEEKEDRSSPAVHTTDYTEGIKTYFEKRKKENNGYEKRKFSHKEIREAKDNKGIIEGTGAVTETRQEVGPFFEVIEEGAFAKTIQENDVRGLFNHDPNLIIGRTSAGTLMLEEQDEGLFFRDKLGNTDFDHFVANRVSRGDVTGASIGFQVMKEEFETGPEEKQIRRIKEVKLFDVGPVTFPAFPQTDIEAKELNSQKSKVLRANQKVGFNFNELTEILLRSENEILCDPQDAEKLGEMINYLKQLQDSVINNNETDELSVEHQQEVTKTQRQMLEI